MLTLEDLTRDNVDTRCIDTMTMLGIEDVDKNDVDMSQ